MLTMALDLSKIEDLTDKGDKSVGRCPACAEQGGDSKSEHLVVYPSGAYACVAFGGDEEHSRLIWELVGRRSQEGTVARGRAKAQPKPLVLDFEETKYPKLDERGLAPIKESFDLLSLDDG